VLVFEKVGIPYAADIFNFVILTAILSAANSGLYFSTPACCIGISAASTNTVPIKKIISRAMVVRMATGYRHCRRGDGKPA
jgi:amino acid permease